MNYTRSSNNVTKGNYYVLIFMLIALIVIVMYKHNIFSDCCYNTRNFIRKIKQKFKPVKKLRSCCVFRRKIYPSKDFQDICSICQEEFTIINYGNGVYQLTCGHYYHKDCIDKWKESNMENSDYCPLCIKKMRVSKYYVV